MALSWNVEDIMAREGKDYVWKPADDGEHWKLSGTTECLIWATMFVGIGRITAANVETFARRLRAWEHVAGCLSTSDQPIPAETVRRHIGLTTNASPIKDAAFAKKIAEIAMRNAGEAIQREDRANAANATKE